MGFFGGTKTIRSESIQKLLKEKDLPHTFKDATAQYLHDSTPNNFMDLNLNDYTEYCLNDSLIRKLERSYRWSKEDYKLKYLDDFVIIGNPYFHNQELIAYFNSLGASIKQIFDWDWGEIKVEPATLLMLKERYNHNLSTNTLEISDIPNNVNVYFDNANIFYSKFYIDRIVETKVNSIYDGYSLSATDSEFISEIPLSLGKTPYREANIFRDSNVPSIPGYTFGNDYYIAKNLGSMQYSDAINLGLDNNNVAVSDVGRYLDIVYKHDFPNGSLSTNKVEIEIYFELSKTIENTHTKTEYYVDENDHSQGFDDSLTTEDSVDTLIDSNYFNVPSNYTQIGNIDTTTTSPDVTINENTDSRVTITKVSTTSITKYKGSFIESLEEYCYSGDIGIFNKNTVEHFKITGGVNNSFGRIAYIKEQPIIDINTISYPRYFYICFENTSGEYDFIAFKTDSTQAQDMLNDTTYLSSNATWYPIIPLKHGNEDMREVKNDNNHTSYDTYKEIKRYARKLGMPYDKIVNNVYDAFESDFDKVKNTFLTFIVPMKAEDVESVKWLHLFFKEIAERCEDNPTLSIDSIFPPKISASNTNWNGSICNTIYSDYTSENNSSTVTSLLDKDNPLLVNKGIHQYLTDNYINRQFSIQGILLRNKQGTLDKEYTTEVIEILRTDTARRYNYNNGVCVNDGTKAHARKVYVYKHKIDENNYEEIIVVNPNFAFEIDQVIDPNSGTTQNNYNSIHYRNTMFYEDSYVPIDYDTKYRLPKFNDRETFYSRNLHIVAGVEFNMKIKWYQSFFFKIVIIIVTGVVNYFFPPSSGFISSLTSTLSASAYGTVAYATTAAIISVVSMLTLQVIMEALQNSVLSTLVRIIALAVAIYNTTNNLITMLKGNLLRADWLTFIGRVGNIYKKLQEEQLNALKRKHGRTAENYEKKVEELERLEKELESNSIKVDLSRTPNAIEQGFIRLGESPSEMVNRCISVQDGLMAISYISEYVKESLQLPNTNLVLANSFNRNQIESKGE